MNYLEKNELKTMLESHVIDEITDSDDGIVENVIQEAIGTVESFLKVRYDTPAIFSKRGNERNFDILHHTKVVAVWYLLLRSNVETLMEKWETEYHRTLSYLKGLVSGTPAPDLPLLKDPDGQTAAPFHATSNPKFGHYF